MHARAVWGLGTALVMILSTRPYAQLPSDVGQIHHNSGDNVAPVFEGWEKNPDGTFNLVFGYLNRNYQEEPEIPVGPNNSFSPGPADQGQPAHFYPRRQQFMFKIKVPADFGRKELVWTLTRNGKTEKAYGTLLMVEELTPVVISENRGGLGNDSVTAKPNQPPTIAASAWPRQRRRQSQPGGCRRRRAPDNARSPHQSGDRQAKPPGPRGHLDALARTRQADVRSDDHGGDGREGDDTRHIQGAGDVRGQGVR